MGAAWRDPRGAATVQPRVGACGEPYLTSEDRRIPRPVPVASRRRTRPQLLPPRTSAAMPGRDRPAPRAHGTRRSLRGEDASRGARRPRARPGAMDASVDEQRHDLPRAEVDDDRVALDVRRAEVVLEQVRPSRRRERQAEVDPRAAAAAAALVEAQDERTGVLGELDAVENETGGALDAQPRRAGRDRAPAQRRVERARLRDDARLLPRP